MILQTRVFQLSNGTNKNLTELARAMNMSVSQVYRVRNGERRINEKFIIGAMRAFPGYRLEELFYLTATSPEGQPGRKTAGNRNG